jgi:DNA-binding beta-propeller fold protein YncE
LTALSGTVVAALPSGSTDLDIAITGNGKFLYTLNSGTGTVGIFAINHDGSLTGIGDAGGLSAAAGYNGIAAN